jgi:hypothetical protein
MCLHFVIPKVTLLFLHHHPGHRWVVKYNKFEMYNKRRLQSYPGIRNLIVASMDIDKYYLFSDKSAKIIRKMWEESDLSIEGVDYDKLSRYLGKHLKKEEIVEEGFEELLYKRKKRKEKEEESHKEDWKEIH